MVAHPGGGVFTWPLTCGFPLWLLSSDGCRRRSSRPVCPAVYKLLPLREDLQRGAQQNDAIELGVERHLVLFASGHEQHAGVLGGQQRLDGVLTPPLAAIRLRLAPPQHRCLPPCSPARRTRRSGSIPRTRHPGGQHPPHGPSLCRRDPEHPAWILTDGTAHSAAEAAL
jgi:hypothetical protein